MNNGLACDEVGELIDAYVDGELAGNERVAVVGHVAHCTICARHLAAARSLSEQLRDSPGSAVPESLASRILDRLPADAASATLAEARVRRMRVVGTHGLAVALGAAAVFAAFVLLPGPQLTHPAEPFVSAHVRELLVSELGSVKSSDPHGVRPWFAGKLPFAPPVVALDGVGYPLVGGYIDYINGVEVAALNYTRRRHRVTVFVAPRGSSRRISGLPLNDRGYNVVAWVDSRFAYRAVSDLNLGELEILAAIFRGATTAHSSR